MALARVLAWQIERVIIAHGVLPTAGGATFRATRITVSYFEAEESPKMARLGGI